MTEDHALIKSNPLLPVEDFNFLKLQGISHIENLASDNWTEYNTSDPGITILEAVSYAITDLAYRTSFDMKDLLTPAKLSKEMWNKVFYTTRQILHSNPVTISDWRKLIVDIEGVRNAWLEPGKDYEVPIFVDYKYISPQEGSCYCEKDKTCIGRLFIISTDKEVAAVLDGYNKKISDFTTLRDKFKNTPKEAEIQKKLDRLTQILNEFTAATNVTPKLPTKILELEGLFNVIIEYEDDIIDQTNRETVREKVVEKLHRHRNLCEDFLSVNSIDYEQLNASGIIILKEDADPDEVLAQIAFTIYRYFSPRVSFNTIDQMMGLGYSVEEIFEGPALRHGFIDTVELESTDMFRDLRLSDLLNLISDIAGVSAISNFYIPLDASEDDATDVSIYFNRWIKKLQSERKVARFDLKNSRFELLKKNSVTSYNTGKSSDRKIDRVAKRFEDLKTQDQAYKLKGHQNDFPVLVGENMEIEDYFPIQYSLPLVYGVDEHEVLPEKPEDDRTIQAYQLKGYLQFFEQILAGYHSQLAHLNDIFSFDEKVDQTYYSHSLTQINNLKDLILDYDPMDGETDEHVFDEFSKLIRSFMEPDKLFLKRRNKFLNHLLARYDEDFSEYEALTRFVWNDGIEGKLIADKITFLQDYQKVSSIRGKGFNYLDSEQIWDSLNITGTERRIGRLLGFKNIKRHTLAPGNLVKETVMQKNGKGELVPKLTARGEGVAIIKLLTPKGDSLLISSEVKDGDCCIDEFMNLILEQAEVRKNYVLHDRIKGIQRSKQKQQTGIFTFSLMDSEGDEIAHGQEFSSANDRNEVIKEIIYVVKLINDNEGMHLVEHILLRPKLDSVLPYADLTEPFDNMDVPVEEVTLLDICLDECDLNKGIDDRIDLPGYRVRISRIPAEKCYNDEPWVLEILKKETDAGGQPADVSVLFQKVQVDEDGKEITPVSLLTFRRYELMNDRLANLREFGSQPDNYRLVVYTDIRRPDAEGRENSKFSFIIHKEDGEPIAQTHFFEKLEDAEQERDAMITYFSYQLDLYCEENPCDHHEDPYSFTTTIILPCWAKRFRNKDYRYFVEKTIQSELPAHVEARVKWVGISQMQRFEDKYYAWLQEFMSNPYPEYKPVNEFVKVLNNIMECGHCDDDCTTGQARND